MPNVDNLQSPSDSVSQIADGAANLVNGVVHGARARMHMPEAFTRAATQAEQLARRGVQRARSVGHDVSAQVSQAGDHTVGYIREEPFKAVLIAAATGAALALLVRMLTRQRRI